MYQALRSYMDEMGKSQSALARALGVSKATLNLYLQNKYVGDVNALNDKVRAFLDLAKKRVDTAKLHIEFVETNTAKQMLSFLGMTHVLGQLGIMYGDAGMGKTTCLKAYQRANSACVLIEPDTTFTAKVLLQELCRVLRLPEKGNMHDLMARVVDCLKDSERLIMVDEAELLPLRALETLRRVHDKAGCAVVLAGMPKLLLNLKGPNAEFKQLFGRVSMHLNLGDRVALDDLKQIACEILGIHDERALESLANKANGSVRKMQKLMENVYYLMRVNGIGLDELDEAFIERAESFLIH